MQDLHHRRAQLLPYARVFAQSLTRVHPQAQVKVW